MNIFKTLQVEKYPEEAKNLIHKLIFIMPVHFELQLQNKIEVI